MFVQFSKLGKLILAGQILEESNEANSHIHRLVSIFRLRSKIPVKFRSNPDKNCIIKDKLCIFIPFHAHRLGYGPWKRCVVGN